MPANIEIKARVNDFAALQQRAHAISDQPLQVISQEDIFFNTIRGRLKLRILSPDEGWLIYYERPDQDGPKRSDYYLTHTSEPEKLTEVLKHAFGVRGVVRKTRYLYMSGQTRIHVDDVDGLGHFMELEVVLRDSQSDAEGQTIAEQLMASLDISPDDLLDMAYIDMIERAAGA